MTPKEYSLQSLEVGQKASFARVLTEGDVDMFANLSGDHNPLHMNKKYAKSTPFKKPIVHGMLLGALCSTLVGMHLPGKHAVYVSQTLQFRKPVYPGDMLVVAGEVTSKSDATRLVEIAVEIRRGVERVVDGVACVQIQ